MAVLSPPPKLQFFDANGVPLVGGKLYSYAAGTTTPLATYTSAAETTFNTNPIILNSRGEAEVWLGSPLYKFKLTTAADVEIWTVDNITSLSGLQTTIDASIKAYYAAPAGSSRVGFIGTAGAVARTAQDKMRDTVSVKDYGAVGDGITNDTAAIQAAINAANGRAVWFPPGAYIVGPSRLELPSNTHLLSDGNSATLKLGGAYAIDMVAFTGVSNITIEGLIFDGNNYTLGATVALIGSNTSNNIVIRNNIIKNFDRLGIGFVTCSDVKIIENYISRNAIASTYNQAILVSTAVGASVNHFIERNVCVNSAINVSLSKSVIRGNTITNFGFGAGITTEQDALCNYLLIEGNIISGGSGIDVNGFRCGGIENWAPGTVVSNNVCFNNSGAGIDHGSNYGVVANNILFNNGTSGAGSGIVARYGTASYNASNSVITGNRAFDVANTQEYGYIEQSASLFNIVVSGNDFNGNKIAPALVLSGTTSYSGPKGSASATYDPPNIGSLASTQVDVFAPGARAGDIAQASFSLDAQGIIIDGYVNTINNVRVTFFNPTGSAINLASGTLMVTYERTKNAANV